MSEEFATMWAVMRPEATGYQFLRAQKTQGVTPVVVPTSRSGIPLPEGVPLVVIDWTGAASLIIQVRLNGATYLTENVASATHGTRRMVTLYLPVESAGHTLDVTGSGITQDDLDKARCGVQIIPSS